MRPFLNVPQTPGQKDRLQHGDDDDIVDRLSSFEEVALTKHLLDPSTLRSATASPFSQDGRLSPSAAHYHPRVPSPAPSHNYPYPPRPTAWKASLAQRFQNLWLQNRGMMLVAASQFFGALMNLSARILEFDGDNGGMHPFQILFARMAITTVCACIYMYYSKVPHFPLGAKEVRWLLVIRGVTGFFGIFPLWMSLMYLPLAEATVISFLAPSVAGFICHLVIKTPFTRREQIASLFALGGVVLIARPTSLFQIGQQDVATGVAVTGNGTTTTDVASSHRHSVEDATPAERLSGIGLGLVGVLGAAGAFSAIRVIGTRAHPLISVTYFSVWCTIVSSTALVVAPLLNIGQPDIKFGLPASAYQWFLLIALGICGFFMQFMLTSGLGKDAKSNRANAMVYTHMLWAAGFDRFIFGHEMSGLSLAGCGLIIGSALWVALAKKDSGEKKLNDVEGDGISGVGGIARREDIRDGVESMPMLERVDDDEDEEVDGTQGIPLQVRAER
ncbi:integral membrane protein duf6 [Rhypophila sp. PSN 637]